MRTTAGTTYESLGVSNGETKNIIINTRTIVFRGLGTHYVWYHLTLDSPIESWKFFQPNYSYLSSPPVEVLCLIQVLGNFSRQPVYDPQAAQFADQLLINYQVRHFTGRLWSSAGLRQRLMLCVYLFLVKSSTYILEYTFVRWKQFSRRNS